MHTQTREIDTLESFAGRLSSEELRKYVRPINTDLTRRQRRTMIVGRNDPCPCVSGKKFKKCCFTGGIAK